MTTDPISADFYPAGNGRRVQGTAIMGVDGSNVAQPITAANPLPVVLSTPGSTTTASTTVDYSVNPIPIPIPQGSGQPPFVLLVTIPATPSRKFVEIQNIGNSPGQSANPTLQIVLDDGTANATSILLFVPMSGSQGLWSSQTFKGRLRVYGVAGSTVAARQDQ